MQALEAMESCQLETASTLILNAANLCQRFGRQLFEAQDASETANHRLLWTVYKLEHAISLRIGRDPALVFNAQVPWDTQACRLGKLSGLLARVRGAESKPSERDVQDLVNPLEDLKNQSHETRESLVRHNHLTYLPIWAGVLIDAADRYILQPRASYV
jgi:hypothetical protein